MIEDKQHDVPTQDSGVEVNQTEKKVGETKIFEEKKGSGRRFHQDSKKTFGVKSKRTPSGGDRKRSRKNDAEKGEKEEGGIEKLVSVRRITKVVKGGKNMRFSALVIVGDGKGKVGYANAKAREVPDAIKKAVSKARKRMIRIPLKFGKTIHHDVSNHEGASMTYLRTAKAGTGVIAGGAMRSMFEALGLQDIVSKRLKTNNPFNVVRSTFNALKYTESPRSVAKRRNLSIQDLNHRRKVLSSRKWLAQEEVSYEETSD